MRASVAIGSIALHPHPPSPHLAPALCLRLVKLVKLSDTSNPNPNPNTPPSLRPTPHPPFTLPWPQPQPRHPNPNQVKLSDTSELDGLMDEAAYKAFCSE